MTTSSVQGGDRPVPRLLLAHGDPSLREGLGEMFGPASYDVDFAENLDEALVVLGRGNVDILVVNSRLPPKGCGALLERCHGPRPIIVIGESTDDVERIMADRRVKSVLIRPFRLPALYDAVVRATN